MTRANEKICDVLIEAGIDHVFGIPGGATVPIWDALFDRQDKIRVLLARHEQAASCMADMYGRMTGKPGNSQNHLTALAWESRLYMNKKMEHSSFICGTT